MRTNHLPVLTNQMHEDCGNKLHCVGSDRKLFCVSCKVQPDASENDGEADR